MKSQEFKSRLSKLVVAITVIIAVALLCFFPSEEYTTEFDGFNLRTRACMRYRSWTFDFLIKEYISIPEDHPVAARLRQLNVLSPIRDEDAQWFLTKGFKAGIRGWRGQGIDYLRALGAYMALSPMPYPTLGDLQTNIWIKWATDNPQASKRFWRNFQIVAKQTERGADFLNIAKIYFEKHDGAVDEKDLEAFVRRVMDEECGIKLPAFE